MQVQCKIRRLKSIILTGLVSVIAFQHFKYFFTTLLQQEKFLIEFWLLAYTDGERDDEVRGCFPLTRPEMHL